MEKKKLLITASTFPRWEGDTEPRFILDYARAMASYYDVTVLAPTAIDAASEEMLEGVHVLRYRYFPIKKMETLCYPGAIVPRIKEKKIRIFLVPFLLLGLWRKLVRIAKDYDYIHAHWIIPQGIVQGFFHKPYLVTGHGTDVGSMNKGIMRWFKQRCLNRASAVTVVSQALAKVLEEKYHVPQVQVIPMGCNLVQFSPENRQAGLFSANGKKVVLFVGRLVEIKGVSYLIDAMRSVDDAVLYIVGKGPLEHELKQQASDMADKVFFMGPRTHQELSTIYASADIFVAPSITTQDGNREGFGLVIIEAMASGLPVIASNLGGIVDIVQNGRNGMLVEEKNVQQLTDGLNWMLTHSDVYGAMRKEALETARQYDYAVIAGKYHRVIESMGD